MHLDVVSFVCLFILKSDQGKGGGKKTVVVANNPFADNFFYFPGYFEKSWKTVNKNIIEALLSVSFYFTQLQVLLFLSLVEL